MTEALPLELPQLVGIPEVLAMMEEAWVIATVWVVMQPLLSVTVKV